MNRYNFFNNVMLESFTMLQYFAVSIYLKHLNYLLNLFMLNLWFVDLHLIRI